MGSHCRFCRRVFAPLDAYDRECGNDYQCTASRQAQLEAATELAWRAIVERDAARASIYILQRSLSVAYAEVSRLEATLDEERRSVKELFDERSLAR